MAFDDGKKTVSGSIAHTDDAAAKVPFVSVKCGIKPTLTGISSVSATQTGRNLLLLTDGTYTIGNTGATATILNGEISVTGTTVNSGGRTTRLSDYFILHAGTYYISPVISASPYVRSYLNKKSDNSAVGYSSGYAFTVSEDTEVYFGINVESGKTYNTTFTPQLEYGSTAHAYEPYQTPTTYTASLGRTIYGGTADIVNGTGTDGYGIITLDGSSDENWGGYSAYNGYYISISDMKSGTRQDGVCNQLTCSKSTAQGQTDAFWLGVGNNRLYVIGVYDSMGNTLETFRAYLAENPLIFVYPLATPTDFTFTPITPTPETVGKVNNVYCNTGDTEVTYYDNAHGFSEITVNRLASNNLMHIADADFTLNNVHYYTVNGILYLDGESTGETSSTNDAFKVLSFTLPKGTYYFTRATHGIASYIRKMSDKSDVRVNNGSFTLAESTELYISFYVYRQTFDNEKFDQMINIGSTAIPYVDTTSISTQTAYLHKVIYGGKADVVKGTCKPKNLLKNLGTFPYTASFTSTYYIEFSNYIQARKIPLFPLQNNVTYVLSADVECSLEPFNLTVGVGDGRYLRDIANGSAQYTSGRVYLKFTPTNLTEGNNYLAFRVPRYGTTKDIEATISNVQLEISNEVTDFAPYFDPFSFPPISIGTDEGENTLFANEGDSAITYRKAVD